MVTTVATRPRLRHIPAVGPTRAVALLGRALLDKPAPWEKDDLLDALYWLRQLLALFLGLAAGAGAHTGLPVFLAHLAITAVLPLAWARSQGVDDDVVGGVGPLMNEGVGPAVGLFTLSWILSYTQAVAKAAG